MELSGQCRKKSPHQSDYRPARVSLSQTVGQSASTGRDGGDGFHLSSLCNLMSSPKNLVVHSGHNYTEGLIPNVGYTVNVCINLMF